MKISTKGRYALRLLLDLAEHREDGFISLKDISERQNISKKYLEQIVPPLKQNSILITTKGFQGGYSLCKNAEKFTVFEILSSIESGLAPVSCLEGNENTCSRKNGCRTLYIWEGLNDLIKDYFSSITLQDILDKTNKS